VQDEVAVRTTKKMLRTGWFFIRRQVKPAFGSSRIQAAKSKLILRKNFNYLNKKMISGFDSRLLRNQYFVRKQTNTQVFADCRRKFGNVFGIVVTFKPLPGIKPLEKHMFA
jgi:hypothetical protein